VFDLVIRNGTLLNGTGSDRFPSDIGIVGNRIAKIGRIRDKGLQELDAEGHVVTPGFIDGHTHMDAQVFWDPFGTSSCWHGVTTVVMGNCGFTLAPAHNDARDLVVRSIERAEDISRISLEAGLDWTWETFPEFLAAVDRTPKGINYAANIGHSALRTWVMGERGYEEEASDEDLVKMKIVLREALRAGSFGFTTTLNEHHQRVDDGPVASRLSSWGEIVHLVGVLSDEGSGIFQITGPNVSVGADPMKRSAYFSELGSLAIASGVPIAFGVLGTPEGIETLDVLDQVADRGGHLIGLAHPRGISQMLSFETKMPFDRLVEWKAHRELPLEEQTRRLRIPEVRDQLVRAARFGDYGTKIAGQDPRPPNYATMFPVQTRLPPYSSVADLALDRNVDPVDVIIDLALEHDLRLFFHTLGRPYLPKHLEAVMRHPRTVMTFSDSGAHVSQMADASIHTFFLAHWVRDREAFTLEEAVKMITNVPATVWGLRGRGLLQEGYVADINVIDFEALTPEYPELSQDLPGGQPRITQRASGYLATIVGGEVVLRGGEHTGSLPGRLVRKPPA
jgi:N-acyl-D-aspartate/D-glutamate deacylase